MALDVFADFDGSVPVPLVTLCSSIADGVIDFVSLALGEEAFSCKTAINMTKRISVMLYCMPADITV